MRVQHLQVIDAAGQVVAVAFGIAGQVAERRRLERPPAQHRPEPPVGVGGGQEGHAAVAVVAAAERARSEPVEVQRATVPVQHVVAYGPVTQVGQGQRSARFPYVAYRDEEPDRPVDEVLVEAEEVGELGDGGEAALGDAVCS